MTSLIAFLLRLVLLIGFTFAFIVLYEHGPSGFVSGLSTEARRLMADFTQSKENSETETKAVPSTPAPTPVPTPDATPVPGPSLAPIEPVATPTPMNSENAPSAWKELQSRPIGSGINQPVGLDSND